MAELAWQLFGMKMNPNESPEDFRRRVEKRLRGDR